MHRLWKITAALAAMLALGGYLVYNGRSTPRVFEVTRRQAPFIATGTVIDRGPPAGWSHLIVKSRPQPGAGDVAAIHPLAKPLTRLIFSSMLANVEKRAGRHVLSGYAVGIGVTIKGKDTIVSPATQAALGADLGVFAREVLAHSYAALEATTQVARSDTMALVDAPSLILQDGKHQQAYYRHALLVEPRTGRLETLMWTVLLDKSNKHAGVTGEIVCLPRNLVEEPPLHVDGKEFTAWVPSDRAFACVDLPPGQRFAVPADLKTLMGQPTLSAAEADQLETRLWELLR